MSENGFTTATDYAALLHQTVKLPSGAVFLLRRPTLSYRLTHFTQYQSIAARAEANARTPDDQTSQQLVKLYYDVLCECCVKPKVSLTPQEGELHPEQIQLRDALLIARWAGGEIDAAGADLAEFREPQRASAAAGASSGNVVVPAERVDGSSMLAWSSRQPITTQPISYTIPPWQVGSKPGDGAAD